MAVVSWSGCATRALWEAGRFARFHEPASPSNLELKAAKDDERMLVIYDEEIDSGEHDGRRAYWLDMRKPPSVNPFRPRFVSHKAGDGLNSVGAGETNAGGGWSAVVGTNGHSFVVFRDGKRISEQELPVYEDGSGRSKQIALTPVAVVCDLTIVGGYLLLYVWAGSSGTIR